tara:strand:- start:53 stop:232 length:180 start_codon:yes stop_codon:yes gene_type:complete
MSKKDSKKDKVKVPFPTDSKGNKWDDEKGLYVTASGIQREVCCEDENTEYCCELQRKGN